jgi:hypothetical protein
MAMSRKWLITGEIGPTPTDAYWVRYHPRQETFNRSKARCCKGVGAVII